MQALAQTVHTASAISPDTLIGKYGTIGLALILFAETGLLVGFFLPGDTLLFSGGLLLATQGFRGAPPLWVPLIVLPLAASIGNVVGYWIGYKGGPAVFNRPNSRIFRPEFVTRTERFFERFGAASIVLARFVPIVRTVVAVMAGVARMRFLPFLVYTVLGAILWADGVFLIGYGLGQTTYVQAHQATITRWIDPVIIAVVLLSLLPVSVHWFRGRRDKPATD